MTIDLPAILRAQGRKRPLTFRVQQTTQAQMRALYRLYTPVMDVWAAGARDRIIPEYARTLATFTGDSPADIEAEIASVDGEAVRVTFDFRAFLQEWAAALQLWHINRIGAQLTYATGIDLSTQLGPATGTIEDFLARNTALIRDVSDQTRGRIADIVFRGAQQRTPVRDIAKEIDKAVGLGRRRSLNIASDQTVKLGAALDALRGAELGASGYEWQHSGKLHYRPEHLARDGKYFEFGSTVDRTDPPGYAPFCFPSDQPVAFHDDAVMLWRRAYSGELFTFVTVSGETVRCTPNHPILTDSGWKAAKLINVGDKLIRSSECGVDAAYVDVEKTQARIGDLFEASKAVFGSVTVNSTGSEFHGDTAPDEQIETVDSQRGLRDHFVSLHFEDHSKLLLEMTLSGALAVRAPQLFAEGGDLSGPGAVRSLRLLEALLWAELLPLDKPSLALVSQLHSALFQDFDKSGSGYSDTLRNGIRTLPSLVGENGVLYVEMLGIVCGALDRVHIEPAPSAESLGQGTRGCTERFSGLTQGIVGEQQESRVKNIIVEPWSGHVHNLETKSGWYSAGTIAVKNCGCKRRLKFDV